MTTNYSQAEAAELCRLAIGRLLRLGSRPEQPGDVAQYYAIRDLVLDLAPVALGRTPALDDGPSFVRSYRAIRESGQ